MTYNMKLMGVFESTVVEVVTRQINFIVYHNPYKCKEVSHAFSSLSPGAAGVEKSLGLGRNAGSQQGMVG